jgi:hypothetical protein
MTSELSSFSELSDFELLLPEPEESATAEPPCDEPSPHAVSAAINQRAATSAVIFRTIYFT